MTMTKAELQTEYDALKAKHEGLLSRITDVAGTAAREHDLCHVLEETLGELGIDVPNITVQVQRTVTEKYTIPGIEAYRYGFKGSDVTTEEDLARAVYEGRAWGGLEDFLSDEVSETVHVRVD